MPESLSPEPQTPESPSPAPQSETPSTSRLSPPNVLEPLARQLQSQLESRGIRFRRTQAPGGELSFLHPLTWKVQWKEDHASVLHGDPPKGWLTLYPVALPQALEPETLMDAFLTEFVEPAATELVLVSRSRLHPALSESPGGGSHHSGPAGPESGSEIDAVLFRLSMAGKLYSGLALAQCLSGQGRLVSYWTEESLFRPGPVEDLLLVVLGRIETPEVSLFAPRVARLPVLEPDHLMKSADIELPRAVAAPEGRFALRLPEDWRMEEVRHEDASGWLLLPPPSGTAPDLVPLICLTGAELLLPLEETLEQALEKLTSGGGFWVEIPATEVALRDQFALVQLRAGSPPDAPGRAVRLWSLGVTDGSSVVHLFAVGDATVLTPLLPTLTALGATLRVLPRVPNQALSTRLVGVWRLVETTGLETEAREQTFQFLPDGSFRQFTRALAPERVLFDSPSLETLPPPVRTGRWEIVSQTLSLYPGDGMREIHEIESIGDGAAIVGRVFWQRR